MRLTRSALRAEAIHVDETEVVGAAGVPLPLTPLKERAPLGEVAANQPPAVVAPKDDMVVGKNAKTKGGKKTKGKKSKKVEEDCGENSHQSEPKVLEDDRRAAGSPASDAAVEDLMKENNNDIVQVPMLDEQPTSPPSRAVRMTRRQLAKAEEELSKPQSRTLRSKKSVEAQAEEAPKPQEQVVQSEEIPPRQEDLTETPEVMVAADLGEPKSLSSEKPIEKDSSISRSPSRSPAKTPMRLEESIEAIDALEEAIEEVGKAIPELDSLEFDEKIPRKKLSVTRAKLNTISTATKTKPLSSKPSTGSGKVSKNPINPKSLKESPHAAPEPKPRAGPAVRPSHSRSASVRTASSKDTDTKSKTSASEVTDYLASKRRPISVSFPTPPPPPKSTKPPTKSTFQLPGEAVAAKLKAQREERQKREEEEAAKKRDFKARPAPIRKNTAPVTVKHTAASKARESMMHGGSSELFEKENKPAGPNSTALPLKRTSSISTSTSGKRQSMIIATSKRTSGLLNRPASTLPGSGSDEKNAPTANHERPPFTTSTSSTSNASKRLSAATVAQATKSTVTPAEVATQRIKAREIFNRDRVEKEERERQRREKEEAAKKARAEAAERGRIASREWAERQRVKKVTSTVAPAKVEEAEAA